MTPTGFPGSRIRVDDLSSWESERHRRGSIRWYPLHIALNATGLASVGSAAVGNPPMLELKSGLATASPQSRGREMLEKQIVGYQMHSGYDGLDFWSRPHRLQVMVTLGVMGLNASGAKSYTALYMTPPGVPTWADPPIVPLCLLRYAKNAAIDGEDERFELITAPGDGVTVMKVTRLVGTDPPRSPVSPGGQRTERYELVYKPGEYVAALINGVEGARHVTSLPDTTVIPGAGANLCGVGVYVQDGVVNDQTNSAFHSMMLETYRP